MRAGIACAPVWSVLACLALAAPASAVRQEAPQDAEPSNEIIVVGVRKAEGSEIVVRAVPRCYGRDGDPIDAVPVPQGIRTQSVIAPDATGTIRWRDDDEPILGPAVWQRTGNAIGDYRFRVPTDGKPLCIGALPSAAQGFAQLRRIVAADGMHGRYVHFSARVMTRKAGEVRFWLAAGDARNRRYRGGDTRHKPIRGTHGWQQVDLIVGPVPSYANHISYGFLLWGRGDAWLADPVLEVLSREQALSVASLPISKLRN
ncbi:hypothetical protein HZY97_03550 [Sphingomonas sp. R-74633]|uniref:hypothetical protein n=1 Tax=Sphingomonas sp. R-74633 TaxID=2751188 RepID=UPI0015D46060|nr:hypothetical protein [Sphingomonas sp. R-74633]NYT39818.1 hypothetical protein [Sphingomonas sp. R-74633]